MTPRKLGDFEGGDPPVRVLLMGHHWDALTPVFEALSGRGLMEFVEQEGQHPSESRSGSAPSVILASRSSDDSFPLQPRSDGAMGQSSTPVLLCVTHEGLETGDLYQDADDFLVVPCSAAELDKRLRRLAQGIKPDPTTECLQVGDITLDLATYQVLLEGKRVHLAWMEFQLLKYMMENSGRVFSREQLLSDVWGVDSFGGTRTVDVHIRRLRQKLGPYGNACIRTVANVGYGLVEP